MIQNVLGGYSPNADRYADSIKKTLGSRAAQSSAQGTETSDCLEISDCFESTWDKMELSEADSVRKYAAVVDIIRKQSEAAGENLRSLVETFIKAQGKGAGAADNATASSAYQAGLAKEMISEDGALGVKAVSDRIAGLAIAFTGGDTSKLPELKDAIEKGFGQAAKAFGGELPDICNRTHDEVMRKLDEWEADAEAMNAEE
jgi:hypothetical protein